MNWIKIERDKNGFATDECLDKIAYFFVEYMMPVVIAIHEENCFDYEIISPLSDIAGWRGYIERNANITHYLPIPHLSDEL